MSDPRLPNVVPNVGCKDGGEQSIGREDKMWHKGWFCQLFTYLLTNGYDVVTIVQLADAVLRAHDRKHGLDATTDHVGITGPEDNLMAINADGLPKDSGLVHDDTGVGMADLWSAWRIMQEVNVSKYNTYVHVITVAEFNNKRMGLPAAPTEDDDTILLMKHGPNQFYSDDYIIDGNGRVDWNGRGLDGVITVGDEVTVLYR